MFSDRDCAAEKNALELKSKGKRQKGKKKKRKRVLHNIRISFLRILCWEVVRHDGVITRAHARGKSGGCREEGMTGVRGSFADRTEKDRREETPNH